MNDMEKKYIIGIWCGCGYLLDTFAVSASCEEEALEILLSKLEKDNRTDLYLTDEEMGDDFDEETDESYIYIDPTMSDPNAFPAYIRAENLKIVAA